MGGAAGHMQSLYEDFSLTFKEIKDIFSKISSGKMMVTEKLDGVCLHLSYSVIDGKARAARNYKNISEGGITLENINLLSERKEFIASVTEAVKVFENIVKKIRIDEQVKIFGPNANYYYNCEIIDPNNPNILLYDRPRIIVHRSGHLKENKFNKTIVQETLKEEFLKLEKLLTENSQLNEDLGNNFIFETNPLRKIDELKDKSCYENAVKNLQNEINKYSVSEGSPLAEYVLSRLDEEISRQIPELTRKCKIKLLERLMRAEGITAKHVYETLIKENSIELTEKVRNLINSERKLLKEAISPIEEIIIEFGTGVLREFKSKSIKDTTQESNRLKRKLQEIFDIVGNSQNREAQNFLNNQFKKIKNIDNINLGCEGIVFKYNNNIYKITGLFSPINQILGMMNYQRGNVAPLKTLISMNENKTAVLSWGRFNPPTIGHEVVFKFGSDLAKQNKADFFIIPTKTADKEKNPLTIQEKITYFNKIFPEYTNSLINSSEINTIIEAAKYFSNRGYKNLKLVVGSDRKEQFEILNKYNNKDYSFNSIEIVSAGERLDEGEGAASMSASKMREAAIQGDIDAFMKGVAGRLDLEEGVKLMNLIRSRIEVVDGDKKKFLEPVSPSLLAEVIRKSGNKWCVFSRSKTKEGKKKKLGCYNSRNGAKKRLRQVEYFKSINEEQDLEEMSGASGVVGHVSTKDDMEETYDPTKGAAKVGGNLSSQFGASLKRDDEPSRKDIIKILIMQEEQFMINRKEFVEEIKLRKIIREGLKRKMKEREEKILQEEKQLRLVIRKLLQEKEEEPAHPITGINILRDLLKKIVPVIGDYYKNLTTSEEQRKSFRAHIVNATKNLLDIEDSPEENVKVDVALKEQENEEPVDPKFISIDKPKIKTDMKPQEEPDTFSINGMDTTGRDVAAEAFKKIEKQIKNSYAILSDEKDKDAFREYLLTNELLHMDKFEKAMKPVVKEPTTPSYEKEKTKLDSNTPEANTTSQLPSSSPQQTPPVSPNPIPGLEQEPKV